MSTELLHGLTRWLDIFVAYERLASAHPFADALPTLTAVSVWLVVPGVVGLARSLRREVG